MRGKARCWKAKLHVFNLSPPMLALSRTWSFDGPARRRSVQVPSVLQQNRWKMSILDLWAVLALAVMCVAAWKLLEV